MYDKDENMVIEALNLGDYPEEQRQDMLAKFYRALDQLVAMALDDQLSQEQLEDFNKAAQEGGPEKAREWLEVNVENYSQLVEKQKLDLIRAVKDSANDISAIADQIASEHSK